jgi:heptosyltransferase II
MKSTDSIIVVRRNRLGDAVSVLPWLQGLKVKSPTLQIDVLASQYNSEVFKRSSVVSNVFEVPDLYLGTALGVLFHPVIRRLIHHQHYDFAMNASCDFSSKAAILSWLAPAKQRVGVVSGKGLFLDRVWTLPVEPDSSFQHAHQVKRVAAVGRVAGLDAVNLPEPKITSTNRQVDNLIRLCPLVNRKASQWPDEQWCRLEKTLMQLGFDVTWLGYAPNGHQGGVLLADNVGEFIELLALAEFVVCSEGGVSHLAPAVGVPTIVLSGVFIRNTWAPWSSNAVVLEVPGNVSAISPEDVIKQLLSFREKKKFIAHPFAFCGADLLEGHER